MLSQEKLAERMSGIGGSDAGTILGLNKYRTPYDLWCEKTSRSLPADLSGNQAVHFGNKLEDLVAQEFADRTGITVQKRNKTFRHPDHDWMLGNVDRLCVGTIHGGSGEKLRCGLEVKTGSAYVSGDWGPSQTIRLDGTDLFLAGEHAIVPASYEAQCRHYMAVLDYDIWFVCVLLGGNDFRMYALGRDLLYEERLIGSEQAFWTWNVQGDVAPAAISVGDLAAAHPTDDGSVIEADSTVVNIVECLRESTALKKDLEVNIERLQIEIKNAMGDAQVLGLDGDTLATWKSSKPTRRFDAKAFKAAHAALHDEFCAESPGSRRFVLKGA